MKNILIVEDDGMQREGLCHIINEYNNAFNIHIASNYNEACKIYENIDIDLFLLDVDLSSSNSEKNGIDIGINIRTQKKYIQTPIIYITGVPEKLHSAINDVHCFYYLMKPYKASDVHLILNEVTNTFTSVDNTVSIRDINGVYISIEHNDIYYIHSSGHILNIYTYQGCFSTRKSGFKAFLDNLPKCFYQVHKSYIVNLTHISSYDKTTRTLSLHNISVPVGRTYKEAFETIYT